MQKSFGRKIVRLCSRPPRRLSASEAEDVLQEVLVKVWKGAHSYDASQLARPWFYRVVRNVISDALGKAWHRHHVESAHDEPFEYATLVSPQRTAKQKCVDGVLRVLEKQHPDVVEALRLVYVAGFTTAELAEYRQENHSTTRSLLARARAVVTPLMQDCQDLPNDPEPHDQAA